MRPSVCDVLIVGGGINGTGIARDLAVRGLKVILCEQDDLAAHTSSSSTKLIHGGLRYLEYGEFSLVRKALREREVLLRSAPHIMRPLRFVMPHDPAMRPAWMIRAGLFLYDHLATRELLPGSTGVDLRQHPAGRPLKRQYVRGFAYSDGWVDDARLVVLNAVDAAERGATVLTRHRCIDAVCVDRRWSVVLQDEAGRELPIEARALINAAGPWAAQFLQEHAHVAPSKTLRLIKGSHIVVPKLFDHDHAYIFQTTDRRIIFAIPYECDFTLIGTTDVEHHGPVGQVHVDDGEITYLCNQASRYFEKPVSPADVVWTYAGVRPLLDDERCNASAVTRDYELDLQSEPALLLTIWGGKITTFRKLAEEAANTLCRHMDVKGAPWTSGALLPGGDLSGWIGSPIRPDKDIARFEDAVARRYPDLPAMLRHRYARAYGTRIELMLRPDGLGAEIAPGLFEAELHYLHRYEWARTADDVLWRRSKLGLHLSVDNRARVARWCQVHGQASIHALREER